MTETTNGATTGADEAKQLAAELAVLEARTKLTAARTAALSALAPGVADGPTGEVTVGAKAGTLGPLLAHQVVNETAKAIAAAVAARVPGPSWHVLVTTDANLLTADVQATLSRTSLTERSTELARLIEVVRTAAETLRAAVDDYSRDERPSPPPPAPPTARDATSADATQAAAPAEKAEAKEPPAGSALGTAVQLVQLTATDFSVSAVEVSADSALLATLTATALGPRAGTENRVTLDGFEVARAAGPTLAALRDLAGKVDGLTAETLALRQLVAPVAAELADRKAAAMSAQSAWADAVADKDVTADRIEMLKSHLERLTAEVARRQAAVGPAQAVVDTATARLDATRAVVVALTTVDAAGISPLARACAREALHTKDGHPVTHVLHVRPTQVGADMVTRRSVLGSSGRVSYLGSASASWALLRVADGTLVGGAQHQAKQLVHDLSTGDVWRPALDVVQQKHTSPTADPQAAHERQIRLAVLVLAFGVAALGVVSALRLVFS